MNEQRRIGNWIQTFTGRQFWPLDPHPEDVNITDIAHSLSLLCRYNGHCKRFYSIAEHSLLVSECVPLADSLQGLLHDAAEAYCGDLTRPLKQNIAEWGPVEARIHVAICQKFNMSIILPLSVSRADDAILGDEQAALMGNPPAPWNLAYPPLGVNIIGYGPLVIEQKFLERFRQLQS